MHTVVVTPPSPIITTADAKQHLRVDHTDDDGYIDGLVATATGWLDGPGNWLGRALGPQTLELRVDFFGQHRRHDCGIALPCPPIASVMTVKYIDPDGVEQTVAGADYRLVSGRILIPVFGKSWPSTRCEAEAVRVAYAAGYADAAAVPKPIRQAILLLVGLWYEVRETVAKDDQVELPFAVSALLSPYRVWTA